MFLPQTIAIADDHTMFRQALIHNLSLAMPTVNWLEAESAEALENLLEQKHDIDLLLLDLDIPGANGFRLLLHVRQQCPEMPVAIVSAHEEQETVQKALELGVAGFIPKSVAVEKLLDAIYEILQGQIWVPEHLVAKKPAQNQGQNDISQRIASLTQQQYKILMMFGKGMLNKQIADELNVSIATIKAHATVIFRKLGVRSRTQAVIAISQLEQSTYDEESE